MRTVIASVLGVLLLAACGGGGGEGGGGGGGAAPPLEALVSGQYVYVYLDRDVTGETVYSEVATFATDGQGAIVFGSGWKKEPGEDGVAIRRANARYEVAADRTWTLSGGFLAPLTGALSSDGTHAVAAVLTEGADPGWFCATRRDPSPTNADLVGRWHFVDWTCSTAFGTSTETRYGTIVIDEAGLGEYQDVRGNRDGWTFHMSGGAPTYTVGPGGLVQVRLGGTTHWQGGLSVTGDVMILGIRDLESAAGVRLLVREGSLSGDAAVAGNWKIAKWTSTPVQYGGGMGGAGFDGAGDATWGVQLNVEGTVFLGAVENGIYGVASDGATIMTWPGLNYVRGGAAPGFLVFSGGLVDDTDPELDVLVR